MVRKLSHLNPEDSVEIIAPGRGNDKEDLAKSIKFIESLGLKASVPSDIFGSDFLCSNTDDYRINHLKNALLSENVRAIWAYRGGYGTTRLISELEKIKPPKNPKLVIGYSDITALHLFLNQRWGWPTLHAPVLSELGKEEKISKEAVKELTDIIFGKTALLEFDDLEVMNLRANKRGIVKGSITGGNLSIIQASIGTPWQLVAKNKFVILEDVDEKAYRVDRMLNQLKETKILNNAAAIILGDFIDKDTQTDVDKSVRRFAEEINVPVLKMGNIGHGKANSPIPFGTPAEIEFGEQTTLRIKGLV